MYTCRLHGYLNAAMLHVCANELELSVQAGPRGVPRQVDVLCKPWQADVALEPQHLNDNVFWNTRCCITHAIERCSCMFMQGSCIELPTQTLQDIGHMTCHSQCIGVKLGCPSAARVCTLGVHMLGKADLSGMH